MQFFGLLRDITRGAQIAARISGAEQDLDLIAFRLDAVARWKKARENGLTAAEAAEAVGIPRATLYRWERRSKPRSRRPLRVRQRQWNAQTVAAVLAKRKEKPMWGKAKIAGVLRRDEGLDLSESTVGRILSRLIASRAVAPAPQLRRGAPRAKRRQSRPHAERLPKGHKPIDPGETVQVDAMFVRVGPNGRPIWHFNAIDPVSRWSCALACDSVTAANARRFLDKLLKEAQFEVKAIQVDGGSEFRGCFEKECERRGIVLYVLPPRSPKLNGHVERVNGTWRYEFYGVWVLSGDLVQLNLLVDAFADEYNRYRPHQALDGQTPAEYLAGRSF